MQPWKLIMHHHEHLHLLSDRYRPTAWFTSRLPRLPYLLPLSQLMWRVSLLFTARSVAKRGIDKAVVRLSVRPSVRPSVCLSVTFRYRGHSLGWNSAKIISRLLSLTFSLSADPNITELLQREHIQILAGIGMGWVNFFTAPPARSLAELGIATRQLSLSWRLTVDLCEASAISQPTLNVANSACQCHPFALWGR